METLPTTAYCTLQKAVPRSTRIGAWTFPVAGTVHEEAPFPPTQTAVHQHRAPSPHASRVTLRAEPACAPRVRSRASQGPRRGRRRWQHRSTVTRAVRYEPMPKRARAPRFEPQPVSKRRRPSQSRQVSAESRARIQATPHGKAPVSPRPPYPPHVSEQNLSPCCLVALGVRAPGCTSCAAGANAGLACR